MKIKIKTNNVPRDIVYGFQLNENEKKEFDWIPSDEIDGHAFVRYCGRVYSISEFMRTSGELSKWDGYNSDSFFSGTLIKLVNDNEQVIMGRYVS
jgi:hypothetical protein